MSQEWIVVWSNLRNECLWKGLEFGISDQCRIECEDSTMDFERWKHELGPRKKEARTDNRWEPSDLCTPSRLFWDSLLPGTAEIQRAKFHDPQPSSTGRSLPLLLLLQSRPVQGHIYPQSSQETFESMLTTRWEGEWVDISWSCISFRFNWQSWILQRALPILNWYRGVSIQQ